MAMAPPDNCFRPSRVYIGVGSNLGDRMVTIAEAARRIKEAAGVQVLHSAPVYETLPVGPAGPDNFLNTVFAIDACLSPMQLLSVLREIEIALGRPVAPEHASVGARKGARTIDLDVLFIDDLVFQNDELVVPHPHAHRREFVLRPMCDLDPEYTHPELGLTVSELLAALPPSDMVLGVVAASVSLAHF